MILEFIFVVVAFIIIEDKRRKYINMGEWIEEMKNVEEQAIC